MNILYDLCMLFMLLYGYLEMLLLKVDMLVEFEWWCYLLIVFV